MNVPEGFEVKRTEGADGSIDFTVYLNGEQVFEWYNGANQDFPEDLCWHRNGEEIKNITPN